MMTASTLRDTPDAMVDWDDRALVEACLRGSEPAWTVLIDRYARLIWSVPIKFRLERQDAEDIFQSVCADLVAQLHTVREPAALRGWLVQVATHKCLRARRRQGREEVTEPSMLALDTASDEPSPSEIIEQVEQHQLVREALATLSDRCRGLLRMLFIDSPTRPYDEVARELGVSRGSVSFLRGRCLQRLQRALTSIGFARVSRV